MGGAAGHLKHIHESHDLTFGEIKDILMKASDAELEEVTEKIDGTANIVLTWKMSESKDQRLRSARNLGDLRSGGMTVQNLSKKFEGRGSIHDAFVQSFVMVQNSFSSVDDEILKRVFGKNGERWISAEIIYTKNPNIINYDMNRVMMHDVIFDSQGNISEDRDAHKSLRYLSSLMNDRQEKVQDELWFLTGPVFISLKKLSDKTPLRRAISQIDQMMSSKNLKDDNTIEDHIESNIQEHMKNISLPENVKKMIIDRILRRGSYASLTQLNKIISSSQMRFVRELVEKSDSLIRDSVVPLEMVIYEFSLEILKGLNSMFVADSDKESERLKKELMIVIDLLKNIKDEKTMSILSKHIKKLDNIDERIPGLEGIVFKHRGRMLKMTGSFAPINALMGFFKYQK